MEDRSKYPFAERKEGGYTEGYWRRTKEEVDVLPFPEPTDIRVDNDLIIKIAQIEELARDKYLYSKGTILSSNCYMSYSKCRLCDIDNGSNETTIKYKDQTTVTFPEGLLHYYCVHNVQPSKEFTTVINQTYELVKSQLPHSHIHLPKEVTPVQVDNSRIILVFSYLKVLREMDGRDDAAKALKTSTEIIEQCKFKITKGEQLSYVVGIGKKTVSYINNILSNTNPKISGIYELDNLDPVKLNKLKTIFEMLKIQGIGIVSAKNYYESGITDIEKLKKILSSGGGTNRQQIGSKYIEEFKKRIPRSKVTLFIKKFNNVIDQYNNHFHTSIRYDVCGSYAREKDTSGDIDIILWSFYPKQVLLNFNVLYDGLVRSGLVKENLSNGLDSCQCVACIDEEYPAVRLDFKFLTNMNEYHYAKLYFTGPAELNREMRDKANSMGMILGNNDLTIKSSGDKIYVRSEQDIFEILGIQWKPASER